VQIVGVGWQGTQEEIDSFVERHGLTFTNVLDADGSIFASFGVAFQPAWVFQDAQGGRDQASGALGASELEARLQAIS
jgi:peroxiredoxin